jgi:hypothetical protein
VPDLEDDLQATSDSLLRDLERIRVLEEEKRLLDPHDPRAAELAARIEELTRRTRVTSQAEREIVEEIQGGSTGAREDAGKED